MAVVLEEKADGKNIHVPHLSESSNANNENETKQQTSSPTIDEANDNASTTPLFIQSEFDLRSIKIAAETAKQQNHLAIQSHPNLSETSSCEYSAIDESLTRETNSDQSNLNLNGSEGDKNNAQNRENSVSIDPRINSHRGRIRNQSELEINDQHVRIQKHYKKEQSGRRRRLTDIDFEGILKIIGGCSTWQILIYLMISVHQVPHAMFNLSVVYFSFTPDHWCKVPVFSREYIENPENEIGSGWTWEKALDSGIAFPQVRRHGRFRHDQCFIYKIPENHFREYIRMNFTAALLLARERPRFEVERCKEWEYDRSIIKESIVTQWHRVCDENWSRAHVHLSCSN